METNLKEIVEALKSISPWPWKTAKAGFDLALVEARDASFIASSPVWLAQMVVGMVEERAHVYANDSEGYWTAPHFIPAALRDFGITPENWTWLKEKVGR